VPVGAIATEIPLDDCSKIRNGSRPTAASMVCRSVLSTQDKATGRKAYRKHFFQMCVPPRSWMAMSPTEDGCSVPKRWEGQLSPDSIPKGGFP